MIIGIFLRHVKVYKGINYIPIGYKHKFISYVGENGSGKSSILEGLDSFLNNKDYLINKSALKDGISSETNAPFFTPIFLIKKDKVTKNKQKFQKISDFFWSIDKNKISPGTSGSMKPFFEIREALIIDGYQKDEYYLFIVGEKNLQGTKQIYFSSFNREELFIRHFLDNKPNSLKNTKWNKEEIDKYEDDLNKFLNLKNYKDFLFELKNLYSYVYIPVEIDIESFTKIETEDMQKIFDKKIKGEIEAILESIDITSINTRLESFIGEIETVLDGKYFYDTGVRSKKSLTKKDLVEKILEVFFAVRVLNKGTSKDPRESKKVSELSAGEKRQALISLTCAFLKRNNERDRSIIIGIDEPENSLHTSLCYQQFEKLKEISLNNQVLVTTHWYGFLPITSKGVGHFLDNNENIVNFETYDLYDYKSKIKQDVHNSRNETPKNYKLKSTNDLVQSVFYSLSTDKPYNWLICEGISEKIYFEYFFKDEIEKKSLNILCVGGKSKVIELYKYLKLAIESEKNGNFKGKIYCLIDTDNEKTDEIGDGLKNICIKRLLNKDPDKTELVNLNSQIINKTEIENSLNSEIFKKTIELMKTEDKYKISTTVKKNGNSDFIKNFKNLELGDFFEVNNGENKVKFSEKYTTVMKEENKPSSFTPTWITEIKNFFS